MVVLNKSYSTYLNNFLTIPSIFELQIISLLKNNVRDLLNASGKLNDDPKCNIHMSYNIEQ